MPQRMTARAPKVVPLDAPAPRASSIVSALAPYDAVAIRLPSGPDAPELFKLDWNESTVPPSPRVAEEIAAHLAHGTGLNWYPALFDRELAADLAPYVGVGADDILVTAGSDAALQLVCDTFLDAGDEVAVPEPTYAHFVLFAKARGARIAPIRVADPFVPHLDALLAAARRRPRMLYLVNPNNPTGLTYAAHDVERLLVAARTSVVVVDEAYIEFGGESVASLVRRHPNLVVTRTFSKAFGLAAARVGYLCAGPAVLRALRVLYSPKSVGTLALVAARAALSDRAYLDWYVREVSIARERLADWFRRRGHQVFAGEGNFLVVRVAAPSALVSELHAAGIYVRDRSSQLAGCFRVSIGTVEQMDRLVARLESLGL